MSVNCDEMTLGACVEPAVGRGVGNELLMGDGWNAAFCDAMIPNLNAVQRRHVYIVYQCEMM